MGAKRKRKEQSPVVSKKDSKQDLVPPVVSLVSPSGDCSDHGEQEVMAILMAQGLGDALDEERARSLIDQTREGEHENPEAWAEACMVVMACDNEIDNEATDVAIAMADSLRQAEAAQTSTSLENEPPAVLLEHFTNKAFSQVAAYLIETNRTGLLGQRDLYDLLDLEAGCAKWYGARSRAYFRELLDGLRETNEDQARAKLRESLDLIQCVDGSRHDTLPLPLALAAAAHRLTRSLASGSLFLFRVMMGFSRRTIVWKTLTRYFNEMQLMHLGDGPPSGHVTSPLDVRPVEAHNAYHDRATPHQ
jgi:hypothetical protein